MNKTSTAFKGPSAQPVKGGRKLAEQELIRFLDLANPQPDILLALGNLYAKNNRDILASACYARCIDMAPGHKEASAGLRETFKTVGIPKASHWIAFMEIYARITKPVSETLTLNHR
jgi:hypothetical protein